MHFLGARAHALTQNRDNGSEIWEIVIVYYDQQPSEKRMAVGILGPDFTFICSATTTGSSCIYLRKTQLSTSGYYFRNF